MTRILFIDVIGGAAGDMLLAALIDAGAPEDRVRAAVDAVLPGRFRLSTEPVSRGGLRARWLQVEADAKGAESHTRPFAELLATLDRAPLPPPVALTARSVLERLGDAEARVHGVEASAVVLHELGDDDTLLDVVGVAAALDALNVEQVRVSSIPLGRASPADRSILHGDDRMPLPAPVTLELLHGFEIRGGPSGEPVTPTAAAVFAALGTPSELIPPMRLEAVGYGAGTRDPKTYPNLVRVLLGTRTDRRETAGTDDEPLVRDLVELEANLDDLTPELIADAVQALLATGALDAWVTPASMKKGRAGFVLSAIGEPHVEPALTRAFFEHTSTFGLRSHTVRRVELARRIVSVPLGGEQVRVKIGLLKDRVVSATPEHDDVAAVAVRAGRSVRDVYEEAMAAARALRYQEAEP